MSKIKSLTVKTTFKVALGSLEVPEEVLNELQAAYDSSAEIEASSVEMMNAGEWLRDNIHLRDCMDCEWEVEDIE